jgi:predicted O-linked N-acetylglucosamine transferase (SPINDLY family)
MNAQSSSSFSNSLLENNLLENQLLTEAQTAIATGSYQQSAILYEQLIDLNPDNHSYYWYLGLSLLLQGQSAEAQTTWLMAMMEGDQLQVEVWTIELVEILESEAIHQFTQGDKSLAWSIRQQIRELLPTKIDNLLYLSLLSIDLQTYTASELKNLGLMEILADQPILDETTTALLIRLVKEVLGFAPFYDSSVELVKLAAPCVKTPEGKTALLNVIDWGVGEIGVIQLYYAVAIPLGEIGLLLDPNHINILFYLTSFYQNIGNSEQGIKLSHRLYPLLDSLVEQVYGKALILRGFMSASGYWQEACQARDELKGLLSSLFVDKIGQLTNSIFFLPYFEDEPRRTRAFHNQLAQICCRDLQIHYQQLVENLRQSHQQRKINEIKNSVNEVEDKRNRPLKIGYISHCLRSHSVGWMARWIFEHADLQKFEVSIYIVCCDPVGDAVHEWYLNKFPNYYKSNKIIDLAEKINQDEIDILVDLDSVTSDVTYEVMALKPAPIQATWLGWDATGLPTIDYYIADDYVLPADAQEYYPEKIWRLPETYIAIDGFEIAVPDLRRDQLDIPADAVVFLSAHTGYKRHPDMIKTHMEIIKGVPGSYFLIKERTDKEGIRAFYGEIAESVGLESDRLRFMPRTTFEAVHRANLGIADVVLDTYPYNGATTTMETLWMCLPMVTRVGEQFAARNSYTMMMNAGITEGIAWSDEEYIEWGIRLGKDKALRQDIACRLKASRQTAPLWNGKKFTRQMEEAYQQMWQIYLGK